MTKRMSAPHVALAAVVIVIWGSNFIVMKWGLDRMPPLAICAWRFLLSFFPACLFLRPPKGHWRLLASFGILTGLGQFGLLSIAMRGLISPAMASVVVQTQAFFNMGLAAIILGERIKTAQVIGCVVAACGLLTIGLFAGATATSLGIILVLLAALSWSLSNVLLRRGHYKGDMISFMVWSGLFATVPLSLLSLAMDGPSALLSPVLKFDSSTAAIIAWQSYANSIFGYAAWNGLIRSYSLAKIAPLTLLVPVIAIGLAAWLLHEPLSTWKIISALLIIGGVAIPHVLNSKAFIAPRA